MKEILTFYNEAIKKVPILKYSKIFIVTVLILALISYFKLKNNDVFLYALGILPISFIAFIFSYIIKNNSKPIRVALYIIIYSIVLTMASLFFSFCWFVVLNKPEFYKRWFPDMTIQSLDTLNRIPIKEKLPSNIINPKSTSSPIKKETAPKSKIISIQLKETDIGYSKLILDGVLIYPLVESTKFNPRISILNKYAGNRHLLIITKKGDSCYLHLPKIIDSTITRLIPQCL